MKVQHLPWDAGPTRDIVVIDGPFKVDGLEGFVFRRENWRFGGYNVFATCKSCNDDATSGGPAGEKRVIRWAWAHQCTRGGDACEGEEDKNLFRD